MDKDFKLEDFFTVMAEGLPELVTRQKVEEITGGLISVKSLQNKDSLGQGITPRLRIGKKVAYPRAAVIRFLRLRCKVF